MKPEQLLLFLKYPYSTAVIACIWIGSAAMIYQSNTLPILFVIATNMIVSWLIAWSSFRYEKSN
jgi:hypothetical protein